MHDCYAQTCTRQVRSACRVCHGALRGGGVKSVSGCAAVHATFLPPTGPDGGAAGAPNIPTHSPLMGRGSLEMNLEQR